MNFNKDRLRELCRTNLKSIDVDSKIFRSNKLWLNFCEDIIYRNSDIVLSYYSLSYEVSTCLLLAKILDDKKELYLPKVISGQIEFYRVTCLNNLEKGQLGILEPSQNSQLFDVNKCLSYKVLMLTAGFGSSYSGYRLGHGKGYYDKYMSEHKIPLSYANKYVVIFKENFLDNGWESSYDEPFDNVLLA